jgi:tRNA pseudouridine55 synthase
MRTPAHAPVCGIVLLDKPAGMSSNAALQRVKRLFGARKAGHTGNLDPLASGMLPVCLGEATKIATALLDARKQYRFVIQLGERTISGDAEHEVIERRAVPQFDVAGIETLLGRFRGRREQIPPMHSALKHEGERLYRLARRGLEIVRTPRSIEITQLAVEDWSAPRLTLVVTCSKGTYVRVLAEEVADALGTCGHVIELRRLWTTPFEAEQMIELHRLESMDPAERMRWLLPIDRPLASWPRVDLEAEAAQRVRHGQSVRTPAPTSQTEVRIYGPDSQFLGLGVVDADGQLRPKRLMEFGL